VARRARHEFDAAGVAGRELLNLAGLDKVTESRRDELRVRDKRQMAAGIKDFALRLPKAGDQSSQTLGRDQKIALARQRKCRARYPR